MKLKPMFKLGLFYLLAVLNGCISVVPVQQANASGKKSFSGMQAMANGMSQTKQDSGAYVLKPLDPIYIRFSGIAEQEALDLIIDEEGKISLLHISEPIVVAGLTTSQLEQKISKLYLDGGIYKNVSVNVTMTAKVYYVQGEVMRPGQVQLVTGTTLLQAIAGSGGYTPFANKRKVTVTRRGKVYKFNMKELEEDPGKDITIEAGDVIKVWQSAF